MKRTTGTVVVLGIVGVLAGRFDLGRLFGRRRGRPEVITQGNSDGADSDASCEEDDDDSEEETAATAADAAASALRKYNRLKESG